MKTLLLCCVLLLLTACDLERYTGFDHSGQELIATSRISGQVLNLFTDNPVYLARVRIGLQETITDEAGRFNFTYVLSEDDERNRPVTLNVHHNKYYPFEFSTVIEPFGNNFTFSIERAAPVIEQAALFIVRDDSEVVYKSQAVLRDYQGAHTISSVTGHYVQHVDKRTQLHYYPNFTRVATPTATLAYYEAQITIDQYTWLVPNYQIWATDNEQFADTLHVHRIYIDDGPIF